MTNTVNIIETRLGGQLVAAGELVDLKFADRNGKSVRGLSLRAGKFLHELINHAGPAITKPGNRFKIDLARINWPHKSAAGIEAIVHELAGTVVCVEMEIKGKPARRWGAFLSDVVRYDEALSVLEYEFTPLIRTVFQLSKHWAALSAQAVYAFESAYALRLYEMITLREGLKYKNEELFSIEDLRQRLGVPFGKLNRFVDFKRKAIEKAIEEVNYLSGSIVEYEARKRGRKVEFILLRWRRKDAIELNDVANRLNKHRADRRVEMKSVVNQMDAKKRRERIKLLEDLQKSSDAAQGDLLDEVPY